VTTYRVEREIKAGPETIWALLTDAAGYPRWNPSVVGIEGRIAPGERIALTSTLNPKRAFKLKVSEFSPPTVMRWSDGMPLGLFSGVRTYRLVPRGGVTAFSMEEVFSGLMAPLITKTIPDMTQSFEQFADGLKRAAEAGGNGGPSSAR
jgi:hypothetical protein